MCVTRAAQVSDTVGRGRRGRGLSLLFFFYYLMKNLSILNYSQYIDPPLIDNQSSFLNCKNIHLFFLLDLCVFFMTMLINCLIVIVGCCLGLSWQQPQPSPMSMPGPGPQPMPSSGGPSGSQSSGASLQLSIYQFLKQNKQTSRVRLNLTSNLN